MIGNSFLVSCFTHFNARLCLMMKKQTAFKIVKTMSMSIRASQDGIFQMVKHFFDRGKGKAVETIHVNPEKEMTNKDFLNNSN